VTTSVWQVFEGNGHVVLAGRRQPMTTGDLFVAPSWIHWSLEADSGLDLFRFTDAPIIEKLRYQRETA
jgi:gentisate 1,2-dioxygenase